MACALCVRCCGCYPIGGTGQCVCVAFYISPMVKVPSASGVVMVSRKDMDPSSLAFLNSELGWKGPLC